MTREGFCTSCEAQRPHRIEVRSVPFRVRGEPVHVDVTYLVCESCGTERVDESAGDPAEMAFAEYRKRHGLLTPEQIKGIREQWALSQSAFATLLGMSQATINRYESGSLQERTHDELIRSCDDRSHMENLFRRRADSLLPLQRRKLEQALQPGAHSIRPIPGMVLAWPDGACGTATEETGYRAFDLERFTAILSHLVRSAACVTRTKLNKLLFYTDFLHFQEHAVSMTGLSYRCYPYGPVSPLADSLLSLLEDQGIIRQERRLYENGNEGTEILLGDTGAYQEIEFSASENAVLDYVISRFGDMSPSAISDASHKEAAWMQTPNRGYIRYRYARELNYRLNA